MGVNSLPKTVTRQRRGCDSNPGPSSPESSTLTTRLPSHPVTVQQIINSTDGQWSEAGKRISRARRPGMKSLTPHAGLQ